MNNDYKKHPKYLEAQKTKLAEGEAAYSLREAWNKLFGKYPSDQTLAIMWAQSALECGRWKSMWLYNWGNIKASSTYEGYHQYFRCNEVINGKVVWFDPPHAQCRFRAYLNATDGAIDYLQFLSKRKNYKPAFEEMKNGNVIEYTKALKRGGYFTASLEHYLKSMQSITNEFHRRKTDLLAWTPPEPVVEPEKTPSPVIAVEPEPPPELEESKKAIESQIEEWRKSEKNPDKRKALAPIMIITMIIIFIISLIITFFSSL